MSAEMTPLDHILQSEVNDCNEMSLNVWRLVVDEASAELNQLRASAAEFQHIRELVSPLEGQSIEDAINYLVHDDSSYEPYRIEIDELKRVVQAQAKRIDSLETSIKAAQSELRSTQRNWDEDCLYRCDDELTRAIAANALQDVNTAA